jgi:hypothetical protein
MVDEVIRDEYDIIIRDDSIGTRIFWLFFVGFATFLLLGVIFIVPGYIKFYFIFFGGILLLSGIYHLLVNHSVTFDKERQCMDIICISSIECLNSIEEVPFLNINRIEIERTTDGDGDKCWHINLITTQGKSKRIYYTGGESYAETLAEKIHKMTGKEISRIVT